MDNIKDSNPSGHEDYLTAINALIDRLHDIEEMGYFPLKELQEIVEPKKENAKLEKSTQSKAVEQSKSKKKKKKKDQGSKAAEDSKPAPYMQTQSRNDPDPLVTALQAMGFTNEQIDAAVLAFGGTDSATADDMVVWILERESNGGIDDGISQSGVPDNGHHYETQQHIFDAEGMQRRAEEQAQREADEAFQRAAEVRAAAERLAAKREEQRRKRREWNNREHIRQQEEVTTKLAEEVQRRKRLEAEKAKALAQRAAEERAAPSVLSGSVPLFSNMSMSESETPNPAMFLNASSVDHPLLPNVGIPRVVPSIDSNIASVELGSGKPRRFPALDSNIASVELGSGKPRRSPKSNRKNRPKHRNSLATTPPPPSFHATAQAGINNGSFPVPYDSNPLGEIRATAREFVPSFAPTSALPTQQTSKPLPQSAPPGLGLDMPQTQKAFVQPSFSILPPQSASGNTLDSSYSILPTFDRSTTPSIGMNRASSAPPYNAPKSPMPGVTASIPGFSMPDNNFMPGVLGGSGNNNHEEEFVSSLIGSLNPLDPSASSPPLSGIWGGQAASTSSNIGGLSNFGFAQSSTPTNSFSSHDVNTAPGGAKKDVANNTWGSFGPSGGGGGSIW